MASQNFLDRYGGQTTEELIALATEFRVDSLVLAFEGAIQDKSAEHPLSQEEGYVLAIEALEREVNNGGYSQFFLNSSNAFAGTVVEALHAIGCSKTARITENAIAALRLEGELAPDRLEEVILSEDETVLRELGECDKRYYDNDEPIADRLFEWIERNRAKIRVGPE
jgi:hypothetical protein